MGVHDDLLSDLYGRARHDIDTGRLPSCQLAVARDGDLIANATFGAPPDARYTTYSMTKAVVAGAIWSLFGSGNVGPSTPVVDVVPEFAPNGKGAVTIEHLMTHTAGFPNAPMRPEEGADRTRRLERFASWRLDYPPGSRTVYHATSASWVLAEVIDRCSGVDYRDFVNRRLLDRLGLHRCRLGTADTDVLAVEMVGASGNATTNREFADDILLRYNDVAVRAAGVPGAGMVGSASQVALYFQALLDNPQQMWDPDVLRDATAHVRETPPDEMLGIPANRTLGLVIAGDDGNSALRQFGTAVGPRTFGAMGVGGQLAWADPDSGLSFCYLTNGLAADMISGYKRAAAISNRAAALAGGAPA